MVEHIRDTFLFISYLFAFVHVINENDYIEYPRRKFVLTGFWVSTAIWVIFMIIEVIQNFN